MTRDYAVELVKAHDHKLDPKALQDFLNFLQITPKQFNEKVDKVYEGSGLFFRDTLGNWKLKNPIWEESKHASIEDEHANGGNEL